VQGRQTSAKFGDLPGLEQRIFIIQQGDDKPLGGVGRAHGSIIPTNCAGNIRARGVFGAQKQQLVNVKIDEDNADLINVESIGDYYYFSFLPIVEESIATQYKRFAIFPNEYVCILDDTQMEEYKENKISYAEDKSIFLKGETLRDKKTKHEFMCVKTPSQFTQY
jgi:hypothetical protein